MVFGELFRRRTPIVVGLIFSVIPQLAMGQSTPVTTPVAPQQSGATATAPVLDPTVNPEADALVLQGVAERRAGQDQQALETFRRAFAIFPSARTRAQMALAEQALGQWVGAESDLRSALADQNDPWIQRNRTLLQEAQTTITSRLATVNVACSMPGAQLLVNGRQVGIFPMEEPIRVETGSVILEVRLEGYRTIQRPITVEAGRTFRESFALVQTTAEGVDGPAGPQRLRVVRMVEEYVPNRLGVPFMVVWGALALGGLGANIFWQNRVGLYNSSSGMRTQGSAQPTCYQPTAEFPTRMDRCGSVLTESWLGFGLMVGGYIAGAGLFSTGLALRIVGGQRRLREQVESVQTVASISCVPSPFANSGITCAGTF